jgi:tetratricopeptide (TPR) repeat protein
VTSLACKRPRFAIGLVCSLSTLVTWSASVRPEEKNERRGPQDAIPLQLHQATEREISGREKDTYQISLTERQYVSIVVEGHSIDLSERILDAQGNIKIQREFNPREAKDPLGFVPEETGTYRFEVSPLYPKAQAGKYRIRLASVRAATQKDLLVSEALELYSQSLELYRTGTYAQALTVGERALQIQRDTLGDNHPEVARTLKLMGLISSGMGEYRTAETLLQRALTIDEKAFGRRDLATAQVLDSLANNLSAQARYTDAENFAKEALAIREQSLGSDHLLVGASLGTLGDIYLAKTDYHNAEVFSARAQELAAKSYGPDDLPYFDFVSRLGRALMRQGNYPRAEQLTLQALHAREVLAGKDSLAFADSMADLGLLYLLERDNVRGDQTLREALSLKEKLLGPEHLQLARILNNLGLIQYRRGDYSTAESLHLRALAIWEKVLGPAHPDVGHSLANLGLAYWREGNYPKATEFYQRALEVEEKAYGPQSPSVAADLHNLGIVAKETGHYDVAETYYLRALAIEEKTFGKQGAEVGVYVESLAILYRDKGDYKDAEPMFLRALAISEASLGNDSPETARLLRNIRQLYSARGDRENALKYFQRIAAIDEANLPLNLAVGSERQKLAYFDSFSEELGKLISFQVFQDPTDSDARDLAALVLLQRKGRVLDASADNLGALRVRSTGEDRALLDEFKEVTSQLAALVLNDPHRTSPEDHQKAVQSLTDQRDRLEGELSRRSMGYYQVSSAVTLPLIQAAIPTDAALVEFSVYRPYDASKSFESGKGFGDPRYIAYVLTSHSDVGWRDLGPAKEIDQLVTAFRQALQDPHRNDVKELSRSLDERIFRPLQTLLGEASHLLLSPDGQLDLVPFEALLDDRDRFLIEQHSVTYLSTGRDLLRLEVPRKSKSGPLLVADPSFGEPGAAVIAEAKAHDERFARAVAARRSITVGDDLSNVYFAPLSGTGREARAIQALFPDASVLSGPQATKAALKNVDAPAILHIATHGFFLRDAGDESTNADADARRGINASVRIDAPLLRSGLALAGAN